MLRKTCPEFFPEIPASSAKYPMAETHATRVHTFCWGNVLCQVHRTNINIMTDVPTVWCRVSSETPPNEGLKTAAVAANYIH